MAKKILITDVTLRDAHQSLIATRMTTEEMLPILEKWTRWGFTLWNAGAARPLTLVSVF